VKARDHSLIIKEIEARRDRQIKAVETYWRAEAEDLQRVIDAYADALTTIGEPREALLGSLKAIIEALEDEFQPAFIYAQYTERDLNLLNTAKTAIAAATGETQ
jgi:hypothetical protein